MTDHFPTVSQEPIPGEGLESADTFGRVRVPIRVKITLPYMLLSLALAVGAAFVITRIVFDTIEERFENQLIESGKLASEWMVREEDRMLETLRLAANTSGVVEAVSTDDAETLRNLIFPLAVNAQEEAIEVLNRDGQLALAMRHRAGGRIEEYDFVRQGDADYLSWPFAEKIFEGEVDELGDKYAGFVRADWGDYFYVAGPIFDGNGVFAGVILIGRTLPSLVDQIRDKTFAQVTIYDFDGQTIESTLLSAEALRPEVAAQALSLQDQESAIRDLVVAGIDYSEIIGPWEIRGDVDLGLIGIALPKTFLIRTTQVTRLQVFLLVALALLLIILMGVNVANVITRPLLGLVRASSEVAQGNLEVRVRPSSNDEVAVLTASFNQMVASLHQSKMELVRAYDITLEGWSKALELRDKETEGHTQRVTEMTVRLARMMGFSDGDLINVRRGALLHDIGKMGIPDAILLKPGPLSDTEWEVMRRHPQYAIDWLWSIEYLRPALEIPYCHHERWDGTGYPRGLKGAEIPLSARIFAVVDVWDALSSDRPYRNALPAEAVIEHIRSESGAHFDPQVVAIFVEFVQGQTREKQSSSNGGGPRPPISDPDPVASELPGENDFEEPVSATQ